MLPYRMWDGEWTLQTGSFLSSSLDLPSRRPLLQSERLCWCLCLLAIFIVLMEPPWCRQLATVCPCFMTLMFLPLWLFLFGYLNISLSFLLLIPMFKRLIQTCDFFLHYGDTLLITGHLLGRASVSCTNRAALTFTFSLSSGFKHSLGLLLR